VKPVYIATFHQSKFGKLLGITVPQMIDSAIQGACRQIGVEPGANTSARSRSERARSGRPSRRYNSARST